MSEPAYLPDLQPAPLVGPGVVVWLDHPEWFRVAVNGGGPELRRQMSARGWEWNPYALVWQRRRTAAGVAALRELLAERWPRLASQLMEAAS